MFLLTTGRKLKTAVALALLVVTMSFGMTAPAQAAAGEGVRSHAHCFDGQRQARITATILGPTGQRVLVKVYFKSVTTGQWFSTSGWDGDIVIDQTTNPGYVQHLTSQFDNTFSSLPDDQWVVVIGTRRLRNGVWAPFVWEYADQVTTYSGGRIYPYLGCHT